MKTKFTLIAAATLVFTGCTCSPASSVGEWEAFMDGARIYNIDAKTVARHISSRDFPDKSVAEAAARSYAAIPADMRREIALDILAEGKEYRDSSGNTRLAWGYSDLASDPRLERLATKAGGFFSQHVMGNAYGRPHDLGLRMMRHYLPVFLLEGIVLDETLPCSTREKGVLALESIIATDGEESEEGYGCIKDWRRTGDSPSKW